MKIEVTAGDKFQRNGVKYIAISNNLKTRCRQCAGFASESFCKRMPLCFVNSSDRLIFIPTKTAKP